MNSNLIDNFKKWPAVLLMAVIIFGVYLRLDQLLFQVLIDDEWHAVNQLLSKTPAKIVSSFGHADYSIPLTLFYWFEAKFFGLSELLMRWPVILFGSLTLLLFTIYVYKNFKISEAILFGFLLSISPLLITFSRRARPYAITLFLVYFSHWLFYKFYNNPKKRLFYGFIYCISAALAIWLHLIVAFFIAAPFIYEFFKCIVKPSSEKWKNFRPLIYLGFSSLLIISLLVVPPLINDMAAISDKVGSDIPTLNTLTGALYLWFGSTSGFVVVCLSLLAVIGFPILIKQSIIAINIIIGFVLTSVIIFIIQPAWVQHSITFTRYVLPIIPLVLMSATIGFLVFIGLITKKLTALKAIHLINITAVMLFIVIYTINSPSIDWLNRPNSQTLHSKYTYDFRPEHNEMEQAINIRPISEFWKTLSNQPMRYKIAVAPWFYGSFHWDAPRWENISKQYTLPGFLIGLCTKVRVGELPDNNERFDFRNVSFLNNLEDVQSRNIDFIVYQKPARLNFSNFYGTLENCDLALQNLYGSPFYEDDLIMVFKTKQLNNTRGKIVDK